MENTYNTYTFEPNQSVCFTDNARSSSAIRGDDQTHIVREVISVPDTFAVGPEYKGFSGLIGLYAGKLIRNLVGHHQWVVLENGCTFSGSLFRPA